MRLPVVSLFSSSGEMGVFAYGLTGFVLSMVSLLLNEPGCV